MQYLRTTLSVALAFAALSIGSEAQACAACGCTLSTDWGSQGVSTEPGFSVDLSYAYLNQNQQRYGSAKASGALINTLNAAGQEIEAYTRTQTVTASLNYTGDTFGIGIQIPFVNRTHGTYGNGPGYNYSTSSDNSIGDVRVISRYTGFSAEKTSGIIAGIKMPTGNTGANFSTGIAAPGPLDSGLQIGTGSTDLIFGGFTSGLISSYGWFAQGTVQRAVATDTAMTGTYRPGDAYTLNAGIRYAEYGAKITPMLQLNIIKRQADTGTSVPLDQLNFSTPVSGGTLAYLAPGASVRLGGGASVYGFVQLPVYQKVNSLQISPQYTLTLGVRQSF
ncbi:MAG: hypothetical protein NTY60_10910 [Proteobacteria bacterium]|nr:hypothetical protein [Pseudomonadota bacterium]